MDLFDLKRDPRFVFAHCISADGKMGAGIAVQFVNEFKLLRDFRNQIKMKTLKPGLKVGTCVKVGRVLNLITKEKFMHKPTYDSLTASLVQCREICWDKNISYLAIPKIGCGLDGLDWKKVREIILTIFGNLGAFELWVCYLDPITKGVTIK